jgi:biopolymer transport protein ExbB
MKRSLFLLAAAMSMAGSLFAQDDTAAKIAAATAQKTTDVTLWHFIQGGGWAMVAMGAMSVLAVMLVIVYTITLRRGAVVSTHFMNTADLLLKKRDYPGLLAIANRHGDSISKIVRRTLDFAQKNPSASFDVIKEIAQTEGSAQAAALQHRVTYLADIAVLSPMVGLLGTVIGIIQSFHQMAISSGTAQATRPMLLAGGVSEALIATGSGLVVGIVSMAFYGYFRNKVQALISDLESASAHILGLIAVNF